MKDNAFFNSMKDNLRRLEEEERARNELKEKIIKEHGWDSDELREWYEEEDKRVFPYTRGEMKAFWTWGHNIERDCTTFEMNDFLHKEAEVTDFLNTLRRAGISSFIYTNQSTAVMRNIHQFVHAGCTMNGIAELSRKSLWSDEPDEIIPGIKFSL